MDVFEGGDISFFGRFWGKMFNSREDSPRAEIS